MHDESSFSSLDGVALILVNNGKITKVNKLFIDMTEYNYDELQDKNIDDVFRILRIGPNVSIDKIDKDVEYFLFTKSLEVKFINIEVVKERNEYIFILRKKSNLQFNDKFDFICHISLENVCGVAIYNVPDATLLKANQMYFNFLEAPYNTPQNAIGKSVDVIITGWASSPIEALWNDIIKSGKPQHIKEFEFDKFSRGITYWDITFTPLYEKGNVKYILIYSHEVTERVLYRKQLEEKNRIIEEQNKLLELFVENMADALILLDKNNKLTLLNKAAEDLFYKPECIINSGDSFSHTRYYDKDGNELTVNDLPGPRILKGEKVNEFFVKAKRPDKTVHYIIKGRPVYNLEGIIEFVVLCVHDISEKVKYEQEKLEALENAMQMKDEFLSMISHELRTPLNVISTAIQAINSICQEELSDRAKKYIGMIRQNTFRQLRLVNNLLDITRANAGNIKINKKNIDIVFLTKSIIDSVYSYASNKKIVIIFKSLLKEKIIAIDDEKYERILLNLLSNAIKFTTEGKSIYVNLSSIKGKVCIEVKDNGIGIPTNKIDIIFERFGQVDNSLSRQAEGTGIGLHLVKKFVEALGGSISVNSKVGIGSAFLILLPDEKTVEIPEEKEMIDLLDNRLSENTNVEFSDIYL